MYPYSRFEWWYGVKGLFFAVRCTYPDRQNNPKGYTWQNFKRFYHAGLTLCILNQMSRIRINIAHILFLKMIKLIIIFLMNNTVVLITTGLMTNEINRFLTGTQFSGLLTSRYLYLPRKTWCPSPNSDRRKQPISAAPLSHISQTFYSTIVQLLECSWQRAPNSRLYQICITIWNDHRSWGRNAVMMYIISSNMLNTWKLDLVVLFSRLIYSHHVGTIIK